MKKKKVVVGMSGGVDSSVAAWLLKEQGYDVIGVTMQIWQDETNVEQEEHGGCCGLSAVDDARRVAERLEIPYYVMNFKKEFKENVMDYFVQEYLDGHTPNPCIACNRYVKWEALLQRSLSIGADYIATGHYAKTEYSEKYGRWVLKKSNAGRKDQSYVLWNIPKELLEHVVFPLANFEDKEQIREIARENNLKVANKPDSEDICFVPDGNYKKFLETNSDLKPKKGNIVNNKGEILGKHTGLYNYTIGQRKGLGISYKVPLFVIGFNPLKNEVIVGEESELYKKEVNVTDINLLLIDEIKEPIQVEVKTRYSSKVAKAIIEQSGEGQVKVIFDEPQRAITPGQSAVFYIDDIVLGGGKIGK